ncbi:hypothetical protein PM082_007567 [Marasmius tenuissimus]|nr:hypothetical protein PM082_007567 [Marasmius tenuissimus]
MLGLAISCTSYEIVDMMHRLGVEPGPTLFTTTSQPLSALYLHPRHDSASGQPRIILHHRTRLVHPLDRGLVRAAGHSWLPLSILPLLFKRDGCPYASTLTPSTRYQSSDPSRHIFDQGCFPYLLACTIHLRARYSTFVDPNTNILKDQSIVNHVLLPADPSITVPFTSGHVQGHHSIDYSVGWPTSYHQHCSLFRRFIEDDRRLLRYVVLDIPEQKQTTFPYH